MRYRIYRIKETPGEQFRWAAHAAGIAIVKARDYDSAEELEAVSPYALWKLLANGESALRPGDLLEILSDEGSSAGLQITKYIGFEPAQWFIPDSKPGGLGPLIPSESQSGKISSPIL